MQDDIASSGQKIKSIMMRIRKNKFILAGSMLVVLVIIIIAVIVHFARK
jgi:flagellar biosynthesis/type III secretory pathway M-ring protein FliF/YscJ